MSDEKALGNDEYISNISDHPAPKYAGIRSFMRSDVVEPGQIGEDIDIGVLGVPFDGGQTKRAGTRRGPSALREASVLYDHRRIYDLTNVDTNKQVNYDSFDIVDCGDAPVTPTSVKHTHKGIEKAVNEIANAAFPLVLGGDHYITYPSFMGFAKAVDDNVGIIHLDAHADTYDSKLFGNHFNGSQFLRIHESQYGGFENHAMVGIRAHEMDSFFEHVENSGLHVSYDRDIETRGIESCVQDAIEHATDGVDNVYLTVDIDVLDPSYAPGTGSPEPGGLTNKQLFKAMDLLGEVDIINAMDLVEVAPEYDPTITTQQNAMRAVSRFFESKFC